MLNATKTWLRRGRESYTETVSQSESKYSANSSRYSTRHFLDETLAKKTVARGPPEHVVDAGLLLLGHAGLLLGGALAAGGDGAGRVEAAQGRGVLGLVGERMCTIREPWQNTFSLFQIGHFGGEPVLNNHVCGWLRNSTGTKNTAKTVKLYSTHHDMTTEVDAGPVGGRQRLLGRRAELALVQGRAGGRRRLLEHEKFTGHLDTRLHGRGRHVDSLKGRPLLIFGSENRVPHFLGTPPSAPLSPHSWCRQRPHGCDPHPLGGSSVPGFGSLRLVSN